MLLVELTRDAEEINGRPRELALNPLTIVGLTGLNDKRTLVHVVNGPALVVRETYGDARDKWREALGHFAWARRLEVE